MKKAKISIWKAVSDETNAPIIETIVIELIQKELTDKQFEQISLKVFDEVKEMFPNMEYQLGIRSFIIKVN